MAGASRTGRCPQWDGFRTHIGVSHHSRSASRRSRRVDSLPSTPLTEGPPAMSALLGVRNISYAYPGHPVLDSVEFSAEGGEFVVLMGVNGAGKSTLLDILGG